MLEEANRRAARGSDVVVGAVDARDREDVAAELEHLELIGDGSTLDTAAVLARRPEVVCVDDLTAGTTSAERRFAAARRLADAGITVVAPSSSAGWAVSSPVARPRFLDEAALLALADEIELVDVPPSILIGPGASRPDRAAGAGRGRRWRRPSRRRRCGPSGSARSGWWPSTASAG